MPFADELIGRPAVDGLADVMRRVAPERDWSPLELAARRLEDLGLSDRARAVGGALLEGLPSDVDAAELLLDAALAEDDFTGWVIWPVTEAVARLTSNSEPRRFDQGLGMLMRLTPRLSSEFALRHFLNHDLERTLDHALRWTRSPDEHVRRLASEGTRLRLPWARSVPALQADPAATTGILDALHRDTSPTVRRSVANHLNDVSRLDPALAVATARRWAADPVATTPAVVRHAMRTLVKQADPGALELLGFGTPEGLDVTGPRLGRDRVALGEVLDFAVTVTNRTEAETRGGDRLRRPPPPTPTSWTCSPRATASRTGRPSRASSTRSAGCRWDASRRPRRSPTSWGSSSRIAPRRSSAPST
ncbi:DNA alkylation repair protein [Nocardioides zeae]